MTVGVDINDAIFGGSSLNRELVIAPTSDKKAIQMTTETEFKKENIRDLFFYFSKSKGVFATVEFQFHSPRDRLGCILATQRNCRVTTPSDSDNAFVTQLFNTVGCFKASLTFLINGKGTLQIRPASRIQFS